MNILLVSPKTPDTFWSFSHALRFVSKKSSLPPLGLLTVAAMLPRTWNLKLVDLDVSRLADQEILWADYVMVGGMIVHRDSIREIAGRCRALDRPVIAGGPIFTTGHEGFPEIDHFVLGEAEGIIARVVADMEAGCLQRVYEAPATPALATTPAPRWDLIRFADYASMSIQFSRGCPFNCEFCDIIVMNGRVPRTKTPEQVVEELEALRRKGWKGTVFLVDDNFIGHKGKVKELLRAMISWRRATGARMDFLTEASVNLADDSGLMGLMTEAGFKKVFLGIETPDLDSLRECSKYQNTKGDLVESVRTIQQSGMEVMGGFILGFDHDTPDIFRRQFEFIQRSGIVTAMVGLLTALPRTRLYQRLKEEGRLLADSTGNNTEAVCNFLPKLGHDTLVNGYRQLVHSLYEPSAYYARARAFLANYQSRGPQPHINMSHVRALFRSFWQLGLRSPGRRAYWRFLAHTLVHRPRAITLAVTLAIYGHHFRSVAGTL
ncbi:MAG: DUF4070 domain-containing protein [Candidatus Eisenbacteria bacterium]|nr:DUF4070 domain-containing protein [Candidatus Eisenbacteria bacterium]